MLPIKGVVLFKVSIRISKQWLWFYIMTQCLCVKEKKLLFGNSGEHFGKMKHAKLSTLLLIY